MTIEQVFDQTATYYDDWLQKALPCYGEVFAIAQELMPFGANTPIRVLDLGAGTGLFSKFVLDKYPGARFVLWDLAEKMLDVARERFRDRSGQFEFVVNDYRSLASSAEFDLVVSSLSIHHLADADKRDLFGRVYAALKDGGVFVNIDQVRGPTPRLHEFYWTWWLRWVRGRGVDEARIQESIARRRAYDQEATLEEQLRWLYEAGFAQVDCMYKHYFVGLFFAAK